MSGEASQKTLEGTDNRLESPSSSAVLRASFCRHFLRTNCQFFILVILSLYILNKSREALVEKLHM